MAAASLPIPPMSPGVGARRKGPKSLPRLPMSAFSPPNSGTSDMFPLHPSPSTVQPEEIVDAYVVAPEGDLSHWKAQAGEVLASRIAGAVVHVQTQEPSEVESIVQKISTSSDVPVSAIAVPFRLEDGVPASLPSYLASASSSKPRVVLSASFTKSSPEAIEALQWALVQDYIVVLDVQCNVTEPAGTWEALEDFLTKSTAPPPSGAPLKGKIILSNILPPSDDLSLPIVKLLTHPTYQAYQAHIASLSLFANVFVNFIPPQWGAATPALTVGDSKETSKEAREWKRRIKMYISPVVEAFGFQRVIFGSSPSPSSRASSRAGDWYELARESFAELGVEQEGIDAVFCTNAQTVYDAR
ncbi:hypothetical protein OBBRIDRAFT_96672 [Obba rivulosa]|uniref:Uncharacterized protein n=1 Tax=Obba rivulosa TaxID=1052685 RepID=A0A8E2AZD8_9APHY|nr:hypothetical protein OBBRIDRAFT_96672 [Obba rivulosa]